MPVSIFVWRQTDLHRLDKEEEMSFAEGMKNFNSTSISYMKTLLLNYNLNKKIFLFVLPRLNIFYLSFQTNFQICLDMLCYIKCQLSVVDHFIHHF